MKFLEKLRKSLPPEMKDRFKIASLVLALLVIPLTVVAIQYRLELRKRAAGLPNDASFTLTATQTNIAPGETTSVSLYLANPSQRSIDGVDVILNFNQSVLQLRNITPNTNTNFKTFLPLDDRGDSFDASGVISQANASGRIEFGAATFDFATENLTSPVKESNVLIAQLEFEGRNGGSSLIGFDFDPGREGTTGETTDSNVVSHSNVLADDILGSTDSLTITVSSIGPTPTPTIAPGQARLTFKFKFQGITSQKSNQTVRVILKQAGEEQYHLDSVGVSADQSGVYTGAVVNIIPGTYDVYIKGWAHLQKKFANVTLSVGENSYNWSGTTLLAGDFNDSNIFNIEDVGLILLVYTQLSVPVNNANRAYDVNSDQVIDIFDISLVLGNYTALEVYGD